LDIVINKPFGITSAIYTNNTGIVTITAPGLELEYDNYVNHKEKIFIPNNDSKGFISRAILYMYREYKCNPKKIIDIEILKKWYYNFPPKHDEIYHNMVVKRIQNKNNIFISNYNKKNKGVKKLFETL
jgi:endonuclease I